MDQHPALAALPTNVADLQAKPPEDVDLNRVQSAELQALVAKGVISPQQAMEWREQQGFELPAASLEVVSEKLQLAPAPEPSLVDIAALRTAAAEANARAAQAEVDANAADEAALLAEGERKPEGGAQ